MKYLNSNLHSTKTRHRCSVEIYIQIGAWEEKLFMKNYLFFSNNHLLKILPRHKNEPNKSYE